MSETPPGNLSPVPSPSSSANSNLRSVTILCYVLFLVAWLNGITAIVGVIIAFVKRQDALGTFWYSHFENLIVVFFVTLAVFLVGLLSWPLALGALIANDFAWPIPALASVPLLFGLLIFPVFAIWYLYRMIRGLLRAIDERAY